MDRGAWQAIVRGVAKGWTQLRKKYFHCYFYMIFMKSENIHDPDNHDGVITDLEPDILECEVKWALASLQTKLVEVMEFQLSYSKS